MKSNKFLIGALGFFVLTTISIIIFNQSAKNANGSSEDQLFADLKVSSIDKIEIVKEVQTTTIKRTDNTIWIVDNASGLQADARRLSRLFDQLLAMKVERVASRSLDNQNSFGINDSSTKIKVYSGDKNILAIQLGDYGASTGQFFTINGKRSIFLSPSPVTASAQPKDWIYKVILKVPENLVKSVIWEEGKKLSKKEIYTREKPEDKLKSTQKRRLISEEKLNEFLKKIESLSFEQLTEREKFQSTSPFASLDRRITVQLFSGRDITFLPAPSKFKQDNLIPVEIKFGPISKDGTDEFSTTAKLLDDINSKSVLMFKLDLFG